MTLRPPPPPKNIDRRAAAERMTSAARPFSIGGRPLEPSLYL